MGNEILLSNDIIHVTGFGRFRGFTETNPSWEAVSLLPIEIEFNDKKFIIEKHEVAVTYEAVDKIVPALWAQNPKLVVHCGVNIGAEKIYLEQFAYNGNFVSPDCNGKCLDRRDVKLCNSDTGCGKLGTKLDLESIVNESNSNRITCSQDPGDYLCGYIYLKSLDVNASRCLFIHVPPICEKFTVQIVSDTILSVIKQCIKQLENAECATKQN